jgi:hypothetical protein
VTGYFELGNKHVSTIKGGEILDRLSDDQLFRKYSVTSNYLLQSHYRTL